MDFQFSQNGTKKTSQIMKKNLFHYQKANEKNNGATFVRRAFVGQTSIGAAFKCLK